MLLSEVRAGHRCLIRALRGSEMLCARLRELGIVEGQDLFVISCGLFGGVVFVDVSGTQVALRREEAQLVEVTQ